MAKKTLLGQPATSEGLTSSRRDRDEACETTLRKQPPPTTPIGLGKKAVAGMAPLGSEVEAVVSALSAGTATFATVTLLQRLLDSDSSGADLLPKKSVRTRSNAKPTASAPVRNGKPAGARTKQPLLVAVHEDQPQPLSGREKYALATETANTCLKLLTDSLKTQPKAQKPTFSHQNAPSTPSTQAGGPRSALQPSSGNTTPVRAPPKKAKEAHRMSSPHLNGYAAGQPPQIIAVAECARLAFAHLRAVDMNALKVREMPKLQLETGMLALVGKLIGHGLADLAVEELRMLKRNLESQLNPQKGGKPSNPSRGAPSDGQTLADLMHLNVSPESCPEAIPVLRTYHQHVLKIISTSSDPAVTEAAAQSLSLDAPNGVVALILRLADHSADRAKAVKQLEALSQTILSVCPSVASAADELAKDKSRSPSPRAVLRLQVLALRMRRLWWKLADHQADVSKELLEPFLKCALAFVRRNSGASDASEGTDLLAECLESLGPLTAGPALFSIHNLLCSQAERAVRHDEAGRWAEEMIQDCATLEPNNAKRISAFVRKTALIQQHPSHDDRDDDLELLSQLLQADIKGDGADYDILLASLVSLARSISIRREGQGQSRSAVKLLALAAGFAQRYARSYAGKSTHQLQTVLEVALRFCRSNDDLLAWVSDDAARIFLQAGTLESITEAAAKRPTLAAWSISSAAVSLGRIVHALLLKAVRTSAADKKTCSPFDNENLDAAQRGALLEWQLKYIEELAPRMKYHGAVKKLLPDLLRRLSRVYAAAEYPIRRARVAVVVFNLREDQPELISPHVFKVWHDYFAVDFAHLGSDVGLVGYFSDVTTRLTIARMFADGQPTVEDLMPSLKIWQQLIRDFPTSESLHGKIDDPQALAQELRSIAAYFSMLGEDQAALLVRRLLTKLYQLCDGDPSATCLTLVDISKQYLKLGYSEKAGALLAQAQPRVQQEQASSLLKLQWQLAYAEYLLVIDNVEKCRAALDETRALRLALPPETISRDDRKAYELLHARGWLVQSKFMLETGYPHDALAGAKRAVRVLNGIWSALERSAGSSKPETAVDTAEGADSSISTLTKGVSKLQLTPTEDSKSANGVDENKRGAAFWTIVPVLTQALLHLSDIYKHHGLFNEANYYSERAVTIAESVGSTVLLSRVRSHRSHLLTIAGRIEEAELSLAQDEALGTNATSLALVKRYCARAAIRAKEGFLQEALVLYEKAECVVDVLSSNEFLVTLDGSTEECCSGSRMASLSLEEPSMTEGKLARPVAADVRIVGRRAPSPKSTKRTKPGTAVRKADGATKATTNATSKAVGSSCYLLAKLKASIQLDKALISIRSGQNVDAELIAMDKAAASTGLTLRGRYVRYRGLIAKAQATLQMDVILNVLSESTLSFPALLKLDQEPADLSKTRSSVLGPAPTSTVAIKTSAKPSKKHTARQESSDSLLNAARDCLVKGHIASMQFCNTAQTHAESSSLSSVSLLLSAISKSYTSGLFHPTREALAVDRPRMKALQFEQKAIAVEEFKSDDQEPLMWPKDGNSSLPAVITAAKFQEEYVDIIPKSWTAVSLCLSEDCSELYIARYRSAQSPLILKLPFSRHKPDDLEEEAFDYHKGKAELQEIIELSNYTCHNSGSLEAKGAKTKWWNERESLDKRLHELLINIENIWFGGFKAIFSQSARREDLLSRFRKSFEQILGRYLPSRKNGKGRNEELALDSKVLELFIGLGSDQDGTIDFEEPLADLLCFVVDMLQFNGERNAYDEIDFDGMAIDVIDALRTYHEAATTSDQPPQHLILVLDRRLQAFPWESMACLDGASVSRVGSMLSLRERIVAMRARKPSGAIVGVSDGAEGRCIVPRTSGAYILNPSSDLIGTQTMLEPALSSLARSEHSQWTSIVKEEPNESQFSSALSTSRIMLYFGHGGGSQYIRPRAIKRLDRCSEVVWLMGCSSGAVSEYGELEPCAVPLAYLLAGGDPEAGTATGGHDSDRSGRCLAVVATLWDITDKDIDRFSLAIGEEWGLWPVSEDAKFPAKTPRRRECIAAPSTPVQVPKTPKTPKVLKTPARAKTPARSRNRVPQKEDRKISLVEAVAKSRDACYLRYLNGAAPVVYGIPVYLGD